MLKKCVSVLLAVFVVYACAVPALAESDIGVISVKLNSDIAGFTIEDTEQLIELKSDNVVYRTYLPSPISIANYAGTSDHGELKAGRTYYIYYMLSAAEGYELPEALEDGDLEIECGKGVTVIHTSITRAPIRDDTGTIVTHRGLMIYAKVVVDGTTFQRIIGFLYDIYLKIKAWQLY